MRKLSINTFVTLDGVMQAPGAPDEDTSGGFTHGGWTVNYQDQQGSDALAEYMGKPFDLLLGRKTYEIFAAYWPKHADQPQAAPLNNARKYVASRTRKTLDWQPAELLGPDVPTAVSALKRGNGPELQVYGSGDLIQTLLEHKLIDELQIWTFPLVLGTGKRLFASGTIPEGFELLKSMVTSTGVTIATYKTGAAIRYGTAGIEPNEKQQKRRARAEAEAAR